MKILEELWHGEIRPAEIIKPLTPQYKELLDAADESEKKLLSLLSDEGKALYRKLTESRRELSCTDECEIFTTGFRLGAKLMLEIMNNKNGE